VSSEQACGSGVAVVITTFDHAHFLGAAITSALSQSIAADEVIVVDDGSHDDPEHVVSRFASVRLIRQANAGLAAARNTGWRAARSDLVVFLDADDRLLPNALEVNRARLVAAPEAGFAYAAYVTVDAASGATRPVDFRPATDGFASFLRGNVIGMHATVMYRRDRLAEVGGFQVGLPACEDYELYLRMSRRFPVVHGPEPVAEYWQHGSNMSRDCALMLCSALSVLRSYQRDARASGMTRAHRQGVAAWKRYYTDAWWRALLRSARSHALDPALLRQAPVLVRHAPLAMTAAPARVAWGRLVRVVPPRLRTSARIAS